jgi:anti-sigma factor RsiW
MLSESDRQLLTAAVDGELGARQLRQVQKLLHRSAEARTLFTQLRKYADSVRQLPRVRSDPALSDSVLQAIRARRLNPHRPAAASRKSLPAWTGYAAAAAVFLLVSGASYVLFAHALDQRGTGRTGDNAALAPTTQPDAAPGPEFIAKAPAVDEPEKLAVGPAVDKPADATPVVQGPPDGPTPPVPDKPRDNPVLTYPATDMVELKMVDIAAPVIVKLQEMEQAKVRDAVLTDLKKAGAFRMEFPCRNGTRAFERFQAVCKAQDIALHIDQTAADRLKQPQFRSNYAVYLENVTPEELARLLQQVVAEDKKPDPKKTGSQLDRLVLVHLSPRDRKELAELLGSDPTAAAGSSSLDIHKPVSDQTASQIAAALTGQGGAPSRPDGVKPAKAPEHAALVIPYAPQHPGANSTEVKRFLENRKPARPGTLQLFLVIREI